MRLRFTYDPEADAAYIGLVPERPNPKVAESWPLGGGPEEPDKLSALILDFDKEGRLAGIEILGAREALPPELIGDPYRHQDAGF